MAACCSIRHWHVLTTGVPRVLRRHGLPRSQPDRPAQERHGCRCHIRGRKPGHDAAGMLFVGVPCIIPSLLCGSYHAASIVPACLAPVLIACPHAVLPHLRRWPRGCWTRGDGRSRPSPRWCRCARLRRWRPAVSCSTSGWPSSKPKILPDYSIHILLDAQLRRRCKAAVSSLSVLLFPLSAQGGGAAGAGVRPDGGCGQRRIQQGGCCPGSCLGF